MIIINGNKYETAISSKWQQCQKEFKNLSTGSVIVVTTIKERTRVMSALRYFRKKHNLIMSFISKKVQNEFHITIQKSQLKSVTWQQLKRVTITIKLQQTKLVIESTSS